MLPLTLTLFFLLNIRIGVGPHHAAFGTFLKQEPYCLVEHLEPVRLLLIRWAAPPPALKTVVKLDRHSFDLPRCFGDFGEFGDIGELVRPVFLNIFNPYKCHTQRVQNVVFQSRLQALMECGRFRYQVTPQGVTR